jgi:hypothetical protein
MKGVGVFSPVGWGEAESTWYVGHWWAYYERIKSDLKKKYMGSF